MVSPADNLDKTLDFKDVKREEWVIVIHEDENSLRKVLSKKMVKYRYAT